jgi:hypothetical protein
MKLAVLFTFIISTCFSQNNLVLFDTLNTYQYKALFINSIGDTISNERIIIYSSGLPWEAQTSQTLIKIFYETEEMALQRIENPCYKRKKKKKINRVIEERTGAIETDSLIWLHPPRSNQYLYTEIAPFPQVIPFKLDIGQSWESGTMFILFGWGKFKGRVKSSYEVVGKFNADYMQIQLQDCWEIKAYSDHNKLGKSFLSFIYQKEYGFLKLDYLFFDGNKIILELESIYKSEKS